MNGVRASYSSRATAVAGFAGRGRLLPLLLLLLLLLGVAAMGPAAARGDAGAFLQEERARDGYVARFDGVPVRALVSDRRGRPWLATPEGLFREEAPGWAQVLDGSIDALVIGGDGEVYCARGEAILRCDADAATVATVARHAGAEVADLAVDRAGTVFLLSPLLPRNHVTILADARQPPRANLHAYDAAGRALELPPALRTVYAFSIAWDGGGGEPDGGARDGALWIAAKQGLLRWEPPAAAVRVIPAGDQRLLGEVMLGLAVLAPGEVWFGNDLGVSGYGAGATWTALRASAGEVPFPYARAIDRSAQGELWIGGDVGAARRDAGGRWTYYQGPQWLPADRVLAICCLGDGRVLLGTTGGLAAIRRRATTLAEKARHFDRLARARHVNRHGFVWKVPLGTPGELASAGEGGYTDNDGLWTASYIASQCLRFAATGDEAARDNARRSMRALLTLGTVTGIPGYPARSVARAEEVSERPELARWYRAPDGVHVYKGDTSSDEIVGHYFAHSLYWDHVATEEERDTLRTRVREMTDHILEHGYTLSPRDDGEPTRWGIWSPERVLEWGHYWYSSGLWSLCILSHLKVAHHMTGDARYEDAYRNLIREHDYARNTVRQKIDLPGHENHSDDQMALFSYYPLLLYERDPELRGIYLESLERSWEIERPEHSATWNFVYNVFAGNRLDDAASRAHLEEIPWLLVDWPHDNTRRWDLELRPRLAGRVELARPLSMKEFGPYGFTDNPYRPRSGGRGMVALSPSIYLLPYWLGRYHGLVPAED